MSTQEKGKVTEGGESEGGPELEQKLEVSAHSVAGNAMVQQMSHASSKGEKEQSSPAPESGEGEQKERSANRDYHDSKKAAEVKKAAKETAKAAAKRAKQSDLRTRAEAILRIAERETSHLHYAPGKWYPSIRPVKLPPVTQLPFKSLGAIRRDLDVYLDYHRREMDNRSAADRDTDWAYEERRPSKSTGKIPRNYSRYSIVASRNANRVYESHLRHLRRALWIREDEDDAAYWYVNRLFRRYVRSRQEVADDENELWNKMMTFRQSIPLGLS